MRSDVRQAIRQVWPQAPLDTFRSFCQAIEELHTRHAHAEKHKCVLLLVLCFKQAFSCHQLPAAYDAQFGAAAPESDARFEAVV